MLDNGIADIMDIRKFITAGKAVFQLYNENTKGTFIFYVWRELDTSSPPYDLRLRVNRFYWAVSVDDSRGKNFRLGTIDRRGNFTRYSRSKVPSDSRAMKAFKWLWEEKIMPRKQLPSFVHFMHNGRCSRCYHKLNQPESIQYGLGPDCYRQEEFPL